MSVKTNESRLEYLENLIPKIQEELETLKEALRKHGVVWGGVFEANSVSIPYDNNNTITRATSPSTPTGLLPAEGADLTVCDGIRG